MGGIAVTEEAMALDVIDAVGPGGHFLEQEHTLRHFRENWLPTLLDRTNYDTWARNGKLTLGDRAADRARKLLETHHPEPLPADVAERLVAVIARAEERARRA
jgi:trimethylamine--corrinoid protein Co-methyltransferase